MSTDTGIPRNLRHFPWAGQWDFIGGLLPGRVSVSDIDMFLERRGNFLFFEGKRYGQAVSRGQAIAFDALTSSRGAQGQTFCLMVVRGDPPDQVRDYGWWQPGSVRRWREADAHGVRAVVLEWWHKASRGPL